jgi:hypothetical protein
MKAYRKLARIWHPDRHKTKEAKEDAAVKFQHIANAYEVRLTKIMSSDDMASRVGGWGVILECLIQDP